MAKIHDTAINRMVIILEHLSRDERYTIEEYAEQFSVSERTIYRDINERLHAFDIVKDSLKRYKFAEGFTLDKSVLETDEMLLLTLGISQIASVNTSFEKKSFHILRKLLRPGFTSPYYIKPELFEAIDMNSKTINTLEDAIQQTRITTIKYKDNSYLIEPYKITSFDGLWYLFAKERTSMKIRTFEVGRVSHATMNHQTFSSDHVDNTLDNVHSAWFEDGACFEVKIKVSAVIAEYFLRKKHLSTQVIEKHLDDGALIITFEVSSDEDIDNLIKAWLPHVEIVSPHRLRNKMISELKEYLLRLESNIAYSR